MPRVRIAVLFGLVAVALAAAACGTASGGLDITETRAPDWPEVAESPALVSLRAAIADAGLPATVSGTVDGFAVGARLTVDFGDGSRTESVTVEVLRACGDGGGASTPGRQAPATQRSVDARSVDRSSLTPRCPPELAGAPRPGSPWRPPWRSDR